TQCWSLPWQWRSQVLYLVRNLIERRMPVDLVLRRLEQCVRIRWIRSDDVGRAHDPDAHALLPPRVHVARVLDCHRRISGMNAADVLVLETGARTNEHFVQRPLLLLLRHACALHAALVSRCRRFSACAMAASRTQRPPSCARRRASTRSRLHGPLPARICWNSLQSIV